MPRKCSVVGCKSNYESERLATKVHLFPKDSVERERWKKALPNILESVTDHMGICAKHWPPDTTMVKKRRFESPKDPPSIFNGVPPSCLVQNQGMT
uniref:THAP-type domain-containing protein n=1 Tax=Macrostomum lignano TaxID=282301 RepID=A0A1I8FK87_9PLAT